MRSGTKQRPSTQAGFAGLDFIRAAFCPLSSNVSMILGNHPSFQHLKHDEVLRQLQIGEALYFPRQFPYRDIHGNRKTGTQIVTAAYGFAPVDFDLLLGLYTFLRRRLGGENIPKESRLTIDFIAKLCGLPATCADDYQVIRSRLFRLSHTKYSNTAFWYGERKVHDYADFNFFDILSLPRMVESSRPITLRWNPSFLEKIEQGRFLQFEYDFYRSLSTRTGRFYFIANHVGWNQKHSPQYLADDFAIHQIGYTNDADLQGFDDDRKRKRTRQIRQADRLRSLKEIVAEAEDLDLVRPYEKWKAYFHTIAQGTYRGKTALRWTRGPRLLCKEDHLPRAIESLENDELFAQVEGLRDEHGQPIHIKAYRKLVSEFGRDFMQKHIEVVLAQKEHHPGTLKNEVGALINRLQHDYPAPDWYQDLKRAERLSPFEETQSSQLSMELYETFFRS